MHPQPKPRRRASSRWTGTSKATHSSRDTTLRLWWCKWVRWYVWRMVCFCHKPSTSVVGASSLFNRLDHRSIVVFLAFKVGSCPRESWTSIQRAFCVCLLVHVLCVCVRVYCDGTTRSSALIAAAWKHVALRCCQLGDVTLSCGKCISDGWAQPLSSFMYCARLYGLSNPCCSDRTGCKGRGRTGREGGAEIDDFEGT